MSDELREKVRKLLPTLEYETGRGWKNVSEFVDRLTEVCESHKANALTAYKKELLSKAIPVAALRVKDKEFEQIQAIPLSAIQEDEAKDA